MSFSAGQAYLQVVPSLDGFGRSVREQIAREKVDANVPVKVKADITDLETKIARAKAQLDELNARKASPKIDLDIATAEAQLAQIKARLSELETKKSSPRVDADVAAAQAKIAVIEERLRSLNSQKSDPKIDLDIAATEAKLAALEGELSALDGKTVDATVRVDDHGSAAGTAGRIGLITAAAITMGTVGIPIAAALGAALGAIGIGAVAGAAGIGAIVMGFSGIGGAVKALQANQTSQGQGAVSLAAQQVSAANSVASAQDGVRSAIRGVEDAQRTAGIANANAAAAVTSAQRGVSGAYTAAGIAETNAAQAVASAQQAVSDAYTASATAIRNAEAGVNSAEQSLVSAQRQALAAQQALTDARQAAQRQLASYENQLKDGVLAERGASLQIKQAKLDLDKVLANPRSTQLQREQAQLTYDQAIQQLDDVQERNKNLAEDKAAADKAGVEGSRQVVAAQASLVSATEGVANAQLAVAAAEANVAEARQAGAARIAAAEQALSNAEAQQAETRRANTEKIMVAEDALTTAKRNQAETARAGAESIVKAQESVVSANRALTGALAQQAAQAVGTASSVDKLQEAMGKLTPTGQQFARFVAFELKPKLDELKRLSEGGLLPGVEAGLRSMFPLIPRLGDMFRAFSDTLGDMARRAGEALNAPFWHGFIDFIKGEAGTNLRSFLVTMGNLATGAAGLLEAFKPVWDAMGRGIGSLAEQFANFGVAAGAGKSDSFNGFMDYVREAWPVVKEFFHELWDLIKGVTQTLAGQGIGALSILTDLLKVINSLPHPVVIALIDLFIAAKAMSLVKSGFKDVTAMFTAVKDLPGDIRKFSQTIMDLPGDIKKVGTALKEGIIDNLDKIKAGGGLKGALLVGGVAVGAYAAGTGLLAASDPIEKDAGKASFGAQASDTADTAGKLLTLDLGGVLDKIKRDIASLPSDMETAGGRISTALRTMGGWFSWLQDVVKAAWLGIGAIVRNTWDAELKPIWDVISNALQTVGGWFKWLWDIANAAWLGIGAIVRSTWDAELKPIWDIINGAIQAIGNFFSWLRDIAWAAWVGIGAVVRSTWDAELKPIWDAINYALQTVGGWFRWLWDKVAEAWHNISSVMSSTWDAELRPIFDALNNAVHAIADSFNWAMGVIQTAWDKLKDIAKIPVNFVIDFVYNRGIVPLWNGIAGLFGLGKLTPIGLLAEGGVIPGYAPGHDTVPALLSRGEGVLVPEAVQGLGPQFVYDANRYYSRGRATGAGSGFSTGGISRFAEGGVVGFLGSVVTDPVGAVRSLFSGVTDSANRTPGGGPWRDALVKIPVKVIEGVIDKAKAYAASILASITSSITGGGAVAGGGTAGTERWRGVSLQALSIAGQSADNIGRLLMQMGTESGGNPTAINRSDINWQHGTPSVGLLQVIGPTYATWHHPAYNAPPFEYGVSEDPLSNILSSIRYTVGRYGSLAAGWQGHGYDMGGWLPPGVTMAHNATGDWERILTGDQWRNINDWFRHFEDSRRDRRRGSYTGAEAGPTGQPISITVNPRADHSEYAIADMVSRRLAFSLRCGS